MRTVSPASRRRRIVSKISVTTFGASPRLGSSRTRRSGLAMRARPIPTICCSPPRTRVPSYAASIASSRSTDGLLAEVRLDDGRVPDDLLWRALRDRAALFEDEHAMRDTQHGPHDVLDDDGAEPDLCLDPPEHLDGGPDLLHG